MRETKKPLPLPNPYHIQIGRTLYKAERVRVWNPKPADGGDPRWMLRTRLTAVEAV